MSWSLGEIRTLSQKAARGIGMPWGLAEEAGYSVDWLEGRGLPGVMALASYLDEIDGADYSTLHCPIAAGATLSDSRDWDRLFPVEIYQPLLLIPFVSTCCETRTLTVRWNQTTAHVNSIGVAIADGGKELTIGPHLTQLAPANKRISGIQCYPRVPADRKDFVQSLNRHAEKTYAPATEASRLSGAGAGLNDND